MPEDSSTLRAAMDRILGAAPGYSAQQTVGQDVRQGGGLSGPSAAASAEDTVQVPTKTPFSNVSSNISQEGGIYDPNARSREIQKEQLKFSNFAMEETARQRAADLAYQKQMADMQAQSQAEQARMMQDQMNMQNQLLNQQSSLSQPINKYQPPNYSPAPQTTVRPSAYVPPQQPTQTRAMSSAQQYGTNQIYPGSQPSSLGTQQIYPGRIMRIGE
jgi:hypothetical protein